MLLIGYCSGILLERRRCEEVHLNLAYRWFCRLDLTDRTPDHSTFSKNRYGGFRESDLLRNVFETTIARCMQEGLVGGQGFAVDAPRAVQEYLDTLDDEAFGGATMTKPKFTALTDPVSQ